MTVSSLAPGIEPLARAPPCLPSRQNTVESRSSEKPPAGHLSSRNHHHQSGRQNFWMSAWEKRRKKLRIVASLGKRGRPNIACSARSARNPWA
jgi:hypothetical protein